MRVFTAVRTASQDCLPVIFWEIERRPTPSSKQQNFWKKNFQWRHQKNKDQTVLTYSGDQNACSRLKQLHRANLLGERDRRCFRIPLSADDSLRVRYFSIIYIDYVLWRVSLPSKIMFGDLSCTYPCCFLCDSPIQSLPKAANKKHSGVKLASSASRGVLQVVDASNDYYNRPALLFGLLKWLPRGI